MEDTSNSDIREFIGRKLEFVKASEPSDIIWENRHFTPWEKKKKSIIVWVILISLLIVSFSFQTKLQNKAYYRMEEYPEIDCKTINV